jgi:hypothetical protein
VPVVVLDGEHRQHADLVDEQIDMLLDAPDHVAEDSQVPAGGSTPARAPGGRTEEDRRSTRDGGAKLLSSDPGEEDMSSVPSEEEDR